MQAAIVAQTANMNIGDYCSALDRKEVIVNRSYQRSDRVWPDTARSYLIESILLGFPIPKFYLNSIADLKTRKTIKEIVDGQQRTQAIHDFLNDKFYLSNVLETEEIRGLNYSSLSEDFQGKFINYNLSIDQFVGAESSEVRQVFRRMNSYTVPLNPEELRHAENQGKFKWFIASIGSKFTDGLASIGVFTDKAVVRMQDLKLYTEIAHYLEHGVTTTSRKSLDNMYKHNDINFGKLEEYTELFDCVFEEISSMIFLKGSNLAKPYQIYSLAIALMGIERARNQEGVREKRVQYDPKKVEAGLLDLSSALELSEEAVKKSDFRNFVEGSAERTNVKEQRQKRIEAYTKVLESAVA